MEFIKSLFRRMRQADHEGAQAIDVPDAEKGRQVIQDATTQINNFERQVASFDGLRGLISFRQPRRYLFLDAFSVFRTT